MAIAIWPDLEARRVAEADGARGRRRRCAPPRDPCPDRPPPGCAGTRRPSSSEAVIRLAPLTTWLLVSTNPSGVTTNPDPLPVAWSGRWPGRWPRGPRGGAVGAGPSTSMRTTEGLTSAATSVTVREYSSRSARSCCRSCASSAEIRAALIIASAFLAEAFSSRRVFRGHHASRRNVTDPTGLCTVPRPSNRISAARETRP